MPFVAAAMDFQMMRPDVVAFSNYQGMKYRSASRPIFDTTRREIDVIRCGKAAYPLSRPVIGTFFPLPASRGEFAVDIFPWIVGEGALPSKAYQHWAELFTLIFQRLYVMRPFEMDATDLRRWDAILGQVNIERYRMSQPLTVLQQGRVVRARPLPELVQWEDGTRERVSVKQMPDEFAGYRVGQWFEAVVHRQPITHKLVKVEYIKRLPPRQSRNPKEAKELWDSLPTSASLPDTDWD